MATHWIILTALLGVGGDLEFVSPEGIRVSVDVPAKVNPAVAEVRARQIASDAWTATCSGKAAKWCGAGDRYRMSFTLSEDPNYCLGALEWRETYDPTDGSEVYRRVEFICEIEHGKVAIIDVF